jgi:DNA-binding transcriptional ArsR family regulator
MKPVKITIDKKTLKAIAADSRLNILKLLHNRKYTLTELSKELNLSKPTLKEHLDILTKVNLIKKEETNHKWKYYSLTFKGENIINPKEIKALLSFVLSLSIVLIFSFLLLNTSSVEVASNQSKMYSSSDILDSVETSDSSVKATSLDTSKEPLPDSSTQDLVEPRSSKKNKFKLSNNLIYLIIISLSLTFAIIFFVNFIRYKTQKMNI